MSWHTDYKKLWSYMQSGECPNQYEFHDIEYGDEWYNVTGKECRIWFDDKSCFRFGYENVIEDDENWAQAESHTQYFCQDITDPESDNYLNRVDISKIVKRLNI